MAGANFRPILPDEHPMLYYLLPGVIKRRCRAIKRISLELESLEIRYREERRLIGRKYYSRNEKLIKETYPTLDRNPIGLIVEKSNDLKELVLNHAAQEPIPLRSRLMKQLLEKCESKCHEILTLLANIDWEMNEFEQSLTNYHKEIENSMTRFHKDLSTIYEKRLEILSGLREPSDEEARLPNYLCRSRRPAFLDKERVFEEVYAKPYNALAEKLIGEKYKGLPEFWLQTMLISTRSLNLVNESDRKPLKWLVDVRFYYDTERDETALNPSEPNSDRRSQTILFFFQQNPYFTNRVLSKTIYTDKSGRPGYCAPDGLRVIKREGCDINWLNEEKSELNRRSFFRFFSGDGLCDQNDHPSVQFDYQVFALFRDFIVPHAVIAYSRGNLFGFEREHRPTYQGRRELVELGRFVDSLFD